MIPRLLMLFATGGLLLPGFAHANAGVPMLALTWPVQWLALIPIVLLESEVARRALKVPFRQIAASVAKANLLSTLVGIPLAWIAMLILETVVGMVLSLIPESTVIPQYVHYAMFPLMSAWVGDNKWQIFAAFVILLVPFCLVSIYIEERVLRRALPDQSVPFVHAFTRRANILSYGLLAVMSLLYPLLVHPE